MISVNTFFHICSLADVFQGILSLLVTLGHSTEMLRSNLQCWTNINCQLSSISNWLPVSWLLTTTVGFLRRVIPSLSTLCVWQPGSSAVGLWALLNSMGLPRLAVCISPGQHNSPQGTFCSRRCYFKSVTCKFSLKWELLCSRFACGLPYGFKFMQWIVLGRVVSLFNVRHSDLSNTWPDNKKYYALFYSKCLLFLSKVISG